MGLKFFGKSGGLATALMGTAMLAIIGNESASAEQIDAANQELDAAGMKGAQLVPTGTLEELTAKADRVDTAEAAVTTAQGAEKTATDALAAATKRADEAEAEVVRLGAQSGAAPTAPRKDAAKNDVQEPSANDHQKTVDALHAKMLGEV
ncbi:hypothetical protein CDA63_11805 [Hymenobacter amundsenii]|uniref:Uncharacterized protein n=1 Tax=Hymenobacter amundsenii TaxID=2006685 RepID=A0A246FJZ1_9BACT|nr:hypothetical protein [Hymenobacter amundsenii]OWP62896.1 hypothetical protein CDA63_11805 [Hymenobacter amundsenii]